MLGKEKLMGDEKLIYTVAQAAEVAACCANSVKQAILDGRLKAVTIGNREKGRKYYRITHRELYRWLEVGEEEPVK